jgi:cell division protein FtsW
LSFANVIAGLARNPWMQAPGRHDKVSRVQAFDPALLWVTVALLAWGMVMVYSASIALPDNPKFSRYAHTFFLTRHALFLALSFAAGLLAFQVKVETWERLAPWLFVASLLLLIVVLIPPTTWCARWK